MLPQCIVLAVLGCALAAPQYQIQEQQDEGIPPHLLRQYIGTQGQAHAQSIQRQVPQAVPAPARLPYNVQGGEQYQRPQYQQGQALAPQQRPQEQRDPEDYDPNPSYQFGFDVNDDQYTNYQNRKEQRDGNVIKGSYSVVDSDGFIRTVTYTADPKEGFKAEVSRQPTDIVVKIPTPKPQIAQQQIPQHLQQQIPQHHVQQQIPQQLQQTHVLQQQRAQPQQQQQYYRYEQ